MKKSTTNLSFYFLFFDGRSLPLGGTRTFRLSSSVFQRPLLQPPKVLYTHNERPPRPRHILTRPLVLAQSYIASTQRRSAIPIMKCVLGAQSKLISIFVILTKKSCLFDKWQYTNDMDFQSDSHQCI